MAHPSQIWKPCGCLIGTKCNCAQLKRERERSVVIINRLRAQENREIIRGNRRRKFCCEKILECCMRGNLRKARIWITKLVAAGFNSKDGAYLEQLDLPALEKRMRKILGIHPRLEDNL